MRISKYTVSFALSLLSSAAFAEDAHLRDLSVEQTPIAQLTAPHPGAMSTSIVADRADATYAVGETVRLSLTASQESYVTVLDFGPNGAVTELFPNRFQADNHLVGGQSVEIAGPTTGAHITVGSPTGTELIKVITSNKPFAVIPESHLQGGGPFRSVDGGVRAALRDLSVVANAPASNETLIAFANYALYTIPSRNGVSGGGVAVIPSQPASVVPGPSHIEIPADQPFPLLIAADKSKYRIGAKPTIAVTTTQACNLTVLEFNSANVARTLYPTATAPNLAVAAQQTVFVAGGPGADLTLAGPVGAEQVLAICTTGDATVAAAAALPPATPNGATDAVVVSRNLSVVANHQGAAMASVIFTVEP